LQFDKVPAERGGVGDNLLRTLLESHKNARLAIAARAIYQIFQRHDGLARAWSALDQRRPAARQAAMGDVVEPFDPGQRFREF